MPLGARPGLGNKIIFSKAMPDLETDYVSKYGTCPGALGCVGGGREVKG